MVGIKGRLKIWAVAGLSWRAEASPDSRQIKEIEQLENEWNGEYGSSAGSSWRAGGVPRKCNKCYISENFVPETRPELCQIRIVSDPNELEIIDIGM